jgi:hypothetical protein
MKTGGKFWVPEGESSQRNAAGLFFGSLEVFPNQNTGPAMMSDHTKLAHCTQQKTTILVQPNDQPESTISATSRSMSDSEERELRSQVSTNKPLMQIISTYLFRKQGLVVLKDLGPENVSPTAPAYIIHVQHCLVPSQTTVGIASQELVTNESSLLQVPLIKCDRDGSEVFSYEAEHDNGVIVAVEREDVTNDEEEVAALQCGRSS